MPIFHEDTNKYQVSSTSKLLTQSLLKSNTTFKLALIKNIYPKHHCLQATDNHTACQLIVYRLKDATFENGPQNKLNIKTVGFELIESHLRSLTD